MAFIESYTPYMADFGLDATLGGATVRGIFDNGYQDVLGIVSGTQPVFTLATTDVGSAAVGDTITISSVAYTIAEIQPDGTGMTRLMLRES